MVHRTFGGANVGNTCEGRLTYVLEAVSNKNGTK